jgi:hypothetical protein
MHADRTRHNIDTRRGDALVHDSQAPAPLPGTKPPPPTGTGISGQHDTDTTDVSTHAALHVWAMHVQFARHIPWEKTVVNNCTSPFRHPKDDVFYIMNIINSNLQLNPSEPPRPDLNAFQRLQFSTVLLTVRTLHKSHSLMLPSPFTSASAPSGSSFSGGWQGAWLFATSSSYLHPSLRPLPHPVHSHQT